MSARSQTQAAFAKTESTQQAPQQGSTRQPKGNAAAQYDLATQTESGTEAATIETAAPETALPEGLNDRLADQAEARVATEAQQSLPASVRQMQPSLQAQVHNAVEAAAAEAFQQCLEVAIRDASGGSVSQPAGSVAITPDIIDNALANYSVGPGLAVLSFEACLADVHKAKTVTEKEMQAALEGYIERTGLSRSAYGIQTNPNITLAKIHVSNEKDNANTAANMQDIVEGEKPKCSDYGNAPGGDTEINPKVLAALEALSRSYQFRISEMTGASHSVGSQHYKGNAFDVDQINHLSADENNPATEAFAKECEKLGASKVLYYKVEPVGHKTHVHASFTS